MMGAIVHLRTVFVVLALSSTVMLIYLHIAVSRSTHIYRTLEHVSGTDNSPNYFVEEHSKDTIDDYDYKRYAMNSAFIDPKLYRVQAHIDDIHGDNKTILWWNYPRWLLPWQQKVDMQECYYNNCKVSFDKNDFNMSDAVVFSIGDRGMSNTPPVPMSKRNPDQAWIFFTLESPFYVEKGNAAFLSPNYHSVFNWSWNYRTDSDIFSPYGWLHTKEILPVRNYSEIFRKKTKQVAWVVSHCRAISGRDEYVRRLNKYIPVDIYGRCGTKAPENISEIISKDYKFYLGFENSLCLDYVTEKFFQYYQYDVITILRGKTKYSDYFPDHSFIDTANFSSIEALGKFLKELGENEQEFIKYIQIKDKYEVHERRIVYRDALCNVCEKMNTLDKNRHIYEQVGNWTGTCDKPKDLK